MEISANLGQICRAGDVLALVGPIGIGKTVFARALINALVLYQDGPELEVTSPTFTLVQSYTLPKFDVFHADLFRIVEVEEYLELGLEEQFEDSLTLIEWPEIAGNALPKRALFINLSQSQNKYGRAVTFSGHCSWGKRLCRVRP